MTRLSTITAKGGATLAALGVASLVAACGSSGHHAAAASGTPASDHTLRIALTSGHLTVGGHALYLWDADRHDKSNCHGACAAAWPPLLTKIKPMAGRGVKAADLSTIARSRGERQVTYNGHPLYYFAGDNRGTTRGQGSDGFGARWWLVNASGSAVRSHSSGKSSSGSGSSGGW